MPDRTVLIRRLLLFLACVGLVVFIMTELRKIGEYGSDTSSQADKRDLEQDAGSEDNHSR